MFQGSVSFVIPMYNERECIERTVKELIKIGDILTSDYEIILSDDASVDGSGLIADKMAEKNPRIKVEHLKKNTKFGGALAAGIKRAAKDVIMYTDSDLPVSLRDIKESLCLLEACDIVTAYSKVHKGETLKRKVMSAAYNFLIQFLFRTNIRDINSGLKIYKRKIFENMELISGSPFVDVEIFVRAKRKGFTVKQYGVIFETREGGKSYISRPAVVLRTMADMLRFKFYAKKSCNKC